MKNTQNRIETALFGTRQKLSTVNVITFGDIFFVGSLAVVSVHQIKYIAKCAFIKVWISWLKSKANKFHAK